MKKYLLTLTTLCLISSAAQATDAPKPECDPNTPVTFTKARLSEIVGRYNLCSHDVQIEVRSDAGHLYGAVLDVTNVEHLLLALRRMQNAKITRTKDRILIELPKE